MAAPIIRIKRSAVPGKKPTLGQLPLGELALNTYDADLLIRRERVGIGSDIVSIGMGATVTNILYVTPDGKDTNTGKKLGDAKATIEAAVAIATTGTVIKVSAGNYIENNPIKLPPQLSIVGDSLREVSLSPQNFDEDLFHVSPGNYISEISFTGNLDDGKAVIAFDPDTIREIDQSPYIRNCTNFISNSIGMKVDGNHALGNLRSMVTDSYTQYNKNGIGVSITNSGYAQLVSLFTICSDTAIFCGAGGAGKSSSITGSSVTYAGGGGGGSYYYSGAGGSGGGGAGGSGDFGYNYNAPGSNGAANLGGGGGGGHAYNGASSGGSGIVVISYPTSYRAATATSGNPTYTISGGNRIYKFNASGSITF